MNGSNPQPPGQPFGGQPPPGSPPQPGPPAGGGPPQPAQPGQAQPGQAQPKKSKKGCILAGCGGCLVVMLGICGFGGYLAYLEEGVSYSHPGEEITSVPLVPGQPADLVFTWDGTGYATHRVYVDLGPGAQVGTMVTGEFGCMDYGSMSSRPVDAEYYLPFGDEPEGWVRVYDGYDRSSPSAVPCHGTLNISQPVVGARLVLTRRQRPSDWLSGL